VIIYGQLRGTNAAGQTILLYHHIAPRSGYTLVGTTTTDAHGFYEFTRAEGVVDTNRSWFVRGPDHTHSRTLYERVEALVSLASEATNGFTGHKVTFTGHVFPDHPFERVLLQERNGSSDDWHTLKSSFTGPDSNYVIRYAWKFPGQYDVRVVFAGDRRNVRGESDPLSLTIQQSQIPSFTINSSAQVVSYGQSTVISGVLDKSASDLTPASGVQVTLMARTPTLGWTGVATATTAANGSYQFAAQTPVTNTLYQVRVTMAPHRHSALLYEGVHDLVSAAPSSTSGTSGQPITFTGTVTPGRADVVVYLQRLGADGEWHMLAAAFTNAIGGYTIGWSLGDPGTDQFRVRALPDRQNLGGESDTMTITVTAPPSSSPMLPAGS
jgi:hypothetical protein